MKPNINPIEVHAQLSDNGHLVDGALVGASSLSHFLKKLPIGGKLNLIVPTTKNNYATVC